MISKLSPADLDPSFASVLTTQGYAPSPKIDGVRLVDLRLLTDDGGSFAELVRLTEQGELEGQGRLSYSPLGCPGHPCGMTSIDGPQMLQAIGCTTCGGSVRPVCGITSVLSLPLMSIC